MIILKSSDEIKTMQRAGRIVAKTHRRLAEALRPGITTQELDAIAEDFIRSAGAVPAFKGYHGFPGSICTSINEQVVHGIPGNHALADGDIIAIDIGAVIDGFYGDSAWTYAIGEVDDAVQKLLKVTEESLFQGIDQARVGNRLSDISHAVQAHVEKHGFSVVKDFVGHGVGRNMHEAPQIPNFGPPHRGPRLKEGMTLAIEPMVNIGGEEVETLPDNWTVVTRDKNPSAHFEHSVAITADGPVILTTL